jgi:hypothetical protein
MGLRDYRDGNMILPAGAGREASMDTPELEMILSQRAGVQATIQVDGDELTVSGVAATGGEKQAALDLLDEFAPEMSVIDDIEVLEVMPAEIDGLEISETESEGLTGATPGTSDTEALEPGDFTDQSTLRDPSAASGPSGTHADDDTDEGDDVYVPPVDPVRRENNEFLGGFQLTAMDDDREVRSEIVGGPADAGLVEAVLFELREDSATTHLRLRVACQEGVVRLRGEVDDILDAENAEAVAARVPGVREVIDETEVRGV